MSRKRKLSRKHKVVAGVSAVAMVAGIAAVTVSTSQAAEACAGLDQALQNNQNFIAAQRANPDAQSEARIANRQAVIDLIEQRRQAAGCQ
jgi:membrane protease subunit (stomatin/prohibitin family)